MYKMFNTSKYEMGLSPTKMVDFLALKIIFGVSYTQN